MRCAEIQGQCSSSELQSSVHSFFLEMSMEDHNIVEDMMVDCGMDFEALPYTAPPREEGLEFSHKGGEHEAFESLASQIAEISGCIRKNFPR
jgi:hypothetical protein